MYRNKIFIAFSLFIILVLSLSAVSATNETDLSEDAGDNATHVDIVVPNKIWKDSEYNITVDAADGSEGTLNISGALNSTAKISGGHGSVPISNLSAGKHKINVDYSMENRTVYSALHDITVLRDSPDWEMEVSYNDELNLNNWVMDSDWDGYFSFPVYITNLPDGITGNITWFEDNIKQYTQDVTSSPIFSIRPDYSLIANHTVLISYSGDDYYKPVNKTITYKVVPTTSYIGHDGISVTVPNNSTGLITINVNGTTFATKKTKKNDDIGPNSNYFSFGNDLKRDQTYEIEIIYDADYGSYYKKTLYNLTYGFIQYSSDINYDEDFYYYFNVFGNLKNNLDVKIDGKKVDYEYKESGGYRYSVYVHDLKLGNHTVEISYHGDEIYPAKTFNSSFYMYIDATSGDNYYSFYAKQFEEKYYYLIFPKDATGNVTLEIRNESDNDYIHFATESLKDGMVKIKLPTEHVGKYLIRTHYVGNYGEYCMIPDVIRTYQDMEEDLFRYQEIQVYSCAQINYGRWVDMNEENILSVTFPDNATGNISLNVSYKNESLSFKAELVNGTAEFALPTNHSGKHYLTLSFNGNYEMEDYMNSYDVYSEYYIKREYNDSMFNSSIVFSLNLPEDAMGNLTLEYNYLSNEEYKLYKTVPIENGVANITFIREHLGYCYFHAYFDGNYDVNEYYHSSMSNPAFNFTNGVLQIMGDNGKVILVRDYMLYDQYNVTDNEVKINISELLHNQSSSNSIRFKYITDSGVENSFSLNFKISYYSPNVKMTYGDEYSQKVYKNCFGSFYYFTGVINDTQLLKSEKISFKIASKTYNVKTDENGVFKIKLNLKPATYTATGKYLGNNFKAKITIKHILSLSKVKVKKSAKKLVLTAKLAKKIKNKKITFKFNGKKYVAKTNKKGVAKVTIKSKVIKKLKVGKKVKYSATYLKDTVKKSVKVSK